MTYRLPRLPYLPVHGLRAQAACGSRHTLLRCASGRVASAGWDGYGQLGRPGEGAQALGWMQLPDGARACGVHAGGWWSLVAVDVDA